MQAVQLLDQRAKVAVAFGRGVELAEVIACTDQVRRANEAASETCTATGAALLDGTVAFRSLRVVRGDSGQPQLERTYLFDYSTDGNTRHQGFVVVNGRHVESIGLQ